MTQKKIHVHVQHQMVKLKGVEIYSTLHNPGEESNLILISFDLKDEDVDSK